MGGWVGGHIALPVHCAPVPASGSPHVSPSFVQSVHGSPKFPHAIGSNPAMHVSPTQHPAQLSRPQKFVQTPPPLPPRSMQLVTPPSPPRSSAQFWQR